MAGPTQTETFDNITMIYRTNFSGREDPPYNKDGDRVFNFVVPPNRVQDMINKGWAVKVTEDKGQENYVEQHYMKVKVKFGHRPPRITLLREGSGQPRTTVTEETVGTLDSMNFSQMDIVISPFNYEIRGEAGTAAYLQTMFAFPVFDDLMAKYENYGD